MSNLSRSPSYTLVVLDYMPIVVLDDKRIISICANVYWLGFDNNRFDY